MTVTVSSISSARPRAGVLALFACLTAFTGCQTAEQPRPMCAIDMGSNSFRRIVGSFADGRYEQRSLEARTLGVGDDLARHGQISEAKLAEIETTLGSFKAACDRDGVSRVNAIATAAFREAPNGGVVVQRASALGIAMEIATEQRESQLAYLVGSLGQDGYAVIDNGSRSIELVSSTNGATEFLVFNLGYRIAYERHFASAMDAAAAVSAFRRELEQRMAPASFMKGKKKLVGLEFAEMVDVLFTPTDREPMVLTVSQLRRRLDEIASADATSFANFKTTKDIDRALPRLVVATFVTEAFGYPEIELTRRELGAGLIIEAGVRR